MRAFDCEPRASVRSEGHRVHYSLVREQEALGMTPGELAGIPLPSAMRQKAIIERANKSKRTARGEASSDAD